LICGCGRDSGADARFAVQAIGYYPCDYLEAMKILEERKNWMAELKAKRK